MSFFTMQSEVSGMIPRAPWDYAGTIVNRALLDAYRQSIWSFLTFESNWTSPSWIQNGTVSVIQGQNTVQFDLTQATPIINAIGSFPSPVTKRQFRIGVGTIYNIWQYSAASGVVTVSGNVVTWVSGSTFTPGMVGFVIVIGGVSVTVISVAGDGLSLMTNPNPPQSSLSGGAATPGAGFPGSTLPGFNIPGQINYQMGGIATLDRPYQEVSGSASGYSIFQCYYVSPVQDFKGWASIRDMLNYNDLFYHQTRAWGDIMDPQRTWYQIPTHVWYYQDDMNPASSTNGWPMFELWGPPTYPLTYQLYGYRKGMALVNPSDEVPMALGEDCVMTKARKYAYEWAEANREKIKGGANYIVLKRDADSDFTRLYKDYRRDDRAMVNAFHTKFRRSRGFPNYEGSYNSFTGIANSGAP